MTAASVIAALCLPGDARVDQRVPKKLLVENGAPTAADKRQINDGIEELLWLAALKPATIGVPVYRDNTREYLEIAVLSFTLRPGAKAARLTELVHRAIPYPVFLIQSQPTGLALSLAHLRWSQGQSGQTVLDGALVQAHLEQSVEEEEKMGRGEDGTVSSGASPLPPVSSSPPLSAFLASLNVTSQPRQHLQALYQGWMERFEAYRRRPVDGQLHARDRRRRRRTPTRGSGRARTPHAGNRQSPRPCDQGKPA
jgi:hypothetical protein